MVHMGKTWNDELIENPLRIIYSSPKQDLVHSGICPKCVGYKTKESIEPLPSGWKEYRQEKTEQVYYFHYVSGDISWSPPIGSSRSTVVVFQKHGSAFHMCRCPLSRVKRLRILHELREKSNEIQAYTSANRVKKITASIRNPSATTIQHAGVRRAELFAL